MPKRKATPHGHGKRGEDGLSDRERAFAVERRKDPVAPGYLIAHRAGFLGSDKVLTERSRVLMKKAAVLAIIHAPEKTRPLDDAEIADELRRFFLTVVRGTASPADKIRAADKLGATLQGFYVPVQVDMKGKMTMEAIVRAMGGAPNEPGMLPEHREDA